MMDDPEFLSLSMGQRGAYVQLIIACKNGRDDGMVSYRDGTALGSAWGCDRKTCGKVLGILAEKSLCTYTKNGSGVITIQLPNYKQWQEMTVDEVRQKRRKNVTKIPSLRPDQIKADQSKAEQTISIPFLEIIEDLNKKAGTNYRSTSYSTPYSTQ